MDREKSSIIWSLTESEFRELIKSSSTYKEALIKLGFAIKSGGNYKTLKKRIQRDKVDVSHIEQNKHTFKGSKKEKPLAEILVQNSKYSTYHLKRRLINSGLIKNQCAKCGLKEEWQGEPISLQLDHINGDHDDNRLENLRILCPNCHSQTNTYSGRNSHQSKSPNRICKCGRQKNKQSDVCHRCFKQPERIIWPSNEELIAKLKTQSFISLAKDLGVSDNAIRKRLSGWRDLNSRRSTWKEDILSH